MSDFRSFATINASITKIRRWVEFALDPGTEERRGYVSRCAVRIPLSTIFTICDVCGESPFGTATDLKGFFGEQTFPGLKAEFGPKVAASERLKWYSVGKSAQHTIIRMFGEAAEYTSGLVGARGHKKSMLLQSKCEERPSEGAILPEHEISFSVCIRAGIAPLLAVSLEQRFLASKHVYLQQWHIASSLSSMCDQWDF